MSLPSGTRLGPYEILSLLGAGGMGKVYKGPAWTARAWTTLMAQDRGEAPLMEESS